MIEDIDELNTAIDDIIENFCDIRLFVSKLIIGKEENMELLRMEEEISSLTKHNQALLKNLHEARAHIARFSGQIE